jgi:hypothetical protein
MRGGPFAGLGRIVPGSHAGGKSAVRWPGRTAQGGIVGAHASFKYLNLRIARSRWRVGWWEFSARLLGSLCWRCSVRGNRFLNALS